MVGIVIASHGDFCVGLKQSTEMIAGVISQCESVPLYPGEDPDAYGQRLQKAIDDVDHGKGVLVLIDLRGGTPCNRSLILAKEKNIILVIGANLAMLLTLALGRNEDSTMVSLASMAEQEAKESIGLISYNQEEK